MQNDIPWTYENEYENKWHYHPLGNLGTYAIIVQPYKNSRFVVWIYPRHNKHDDVFENLLDAKIYAIATCAELDQKRLNMEIM